MARSALPVADADVLSQRGPLTFQSGKIIYQIGTAAGKSAYAVTDGTQNLSAPLTWSFGDGHVGQSYLFERDGKFYESRVSYFDTLKALDFTPGRKLTDPQNLEQAMARSITTTRCTLPNARALITPRRQICRLRAPAPLTRSPTQHPR
jgi:hypothetical protein